MGSGGLSEDSLCRRNEWFVESWRTKKSLLKNPSSDSRYQCILENWTAGRHGPSEGIPSGRCWAPLLGVRALAGGFVVAERLTGCRAPRSKPPPAPNPAPRPLSPGGLAADRAGAAGRGGLRARPKGWFFFFFLVKLWPREPPPIHFCANRATRTDPERGQAPPPPGPLHNAPCVT